MKVGIFGRGRLASAIATLGADTVAWKLGRNETPPRDITVDAVIDASVGGAVEKHLDWALENGVDFIVGATGWSMPDLS